MIITTTLLLIGSFTPLVFSAATPESIWPYPQLVSSHSAHYRLIRTDDFHILTSSKCDLLTSAIKRYTEDRLFIQDCHKLDPTFKGQFFIPHRINSDHDTNNKGLLKNLTISFTGDCETWPHLAMVEKYHLRVDEHGAQIVGASIWGALRGLETFSQLLKNRGRDEFSVNLVTIDDFPRFSHRGLLIDSARHFLPLRTIYQTLDAMEMNKMNVLHWHITDDQSFPFVSETFPALSQKGAFEPNTHIYTKAQVDTVLQYARHRGIRVLVEFDSPGHTQSWGKGQADLLTQCYGSNGKPNGQHGPIDPTQDHVFKFVEQFFAEVAHRFPDQYLHLGGDEVEYDCWASNPVVKAFMAKHKMAADYKKLEGFYIQKLLDIVKSLKKSYIVWEEVFNHNATLLPDTVVHVWLPYNAKPVDRWSDGLARVTKAGYRALLSSPWYINRFTYGSDWDRYYQVEPLAFNGTDAQKKLIMGGEACLWAEYVNGANVIGRAWPRASAIAERLWSPASLTDPQQARPRYRDNYCRMLKQGLRVEPPQDEHDGVWCKCDVAL